MQHLRDRLLLASPKCPWALRPSSLRPPGENSKEPFPAYHVCGETSGARATTRWRATHAQLLSVPDLAPRRSIIWGTFCSFFTERFCGAGLLQQFLRILRLVKVTLAWVTYQMSAPKSSWLCGSADPDPKMHLPGTWVWLKEAASLQEPPWSPGWLSGQTLPFKP